MANTKLARRLLLTTSLIGGALIAQAAPALAQPRPDRGDGSVARTGAAGYPDCDFRGAG